MKFRSVLVRLGISCLLVPATAVWAQEPAPETETVPAEEAAEVEEYAVKAYSLTFWGGWFSGATFLNLQPLADRTQVEEGSDEVYKYDGTIFTPQELDFGTWKYDGAQKKIEPGPMFGARLGVYLSENFHIDLVGAYGKTKATTSFINYDPENPESPFREQLDQDDNVTIFMGGGRMVYDAKSVKFLGFSPTIGFGIGGIINRFSQLEDKTGLYFELSGGLNYTLSKSFLLNLEFSALTFSFNREELQYGEQVTYMGARLGITWMIPVGPQTPTEQVE